MSKIELSNMPAGEKAFKPENEGEREYTKEDEDKKQKEEHKIMLRNVKFKIIFYIIYIIAFVFFLYIIKPILFCIELYFLMNTGNYGDPNILYAGWFLLFLLPLIHFYYDGIKIIAIQDTMFLKIYTGLIVLIEIYIMIPIPFMHIKTIYSIYLFNERGIELIIAPWLIFFPTSYIISTTEIFRNFVTSIYFISYTIYIIQKNKNLEINLNRTYTFLIAVEVINTIGYLIFLVKRIYRYALDQKRKNRLEKEREKKEKQEKKNLRASSSKIDDVMKDK